MAAFGAHGSAAPPPPAPPPTASPAPAPPDPAGNLTAWNGATYQYDRFNQMTRMTSGGEDWFYLYTADDRADLVLHSGR